MLHARDRLELSVEPPVAVPTVSEHHDVTVAPSRMACDRCPWPIHRSSPEVLPFHHSYQPEQTMDRRLLLFLGVLRSACRSRAGPNLERSCAALVEAQLPRGKRDGLCCRSSMSELELLADADARAARY